MKKYLVLSALISTSAFAQSPHWDQMTATYQQQSIPGEDGFYSVSGEKTYGASITKLTNEYFLMSGSLAKEQATVVGDNWDVDLESNDVLLSLGARYPLRDNTDVFGFMSQQKSTVKIDGLETTPYSGSTLTAGVRSRINDFDVAAWISGAMGGDASGESYIAEARYYVTPKMSLGMQLYTHPDNNVKAVAATMSLDY